MDRVARVIGDALGAAVTGVYAHGSMVSGGLRPSSDLDLLVVTDGRPDERRRRGLLTGLLSVSGRRAPTPGRPVEVSVVARSDIDPWRYPPVSAFQYGEWLRDEYEAGLLPGPREDPDLALLLAVARQGDGSLVGPHVREVVPEIPLADVRAATVAGVPGLLNDLDDDTRNVLLTLARVVTTLTTGQVVPKDVAVAHARRHVGPQHAGILDAARDDYLGSATTDWASVLPAARACARDLTGAIDALAS